MSARPKKAIREISVSEFKTNCLSLIKQVEKTKAPIRLTKRGKPIAEVIPVSPEADARRNWIGSLSGEMKTSVISYLRSWTFDILRSSKIETVTLGPFFHFREALPLCLPEL